MQCCSRYRENESACGVFYCRPAEGRHFMHYCCRENQYMQITQIHNQITRSNTFFKRSLFKYKYVFVSMQFCMTSKLKRAQMYFWSLIIILMMNIFPLSCTYTNIRINFCQYFYNPPHPPQ